MSWRREREEGEKARAGRAEGWKEGPEEEPGRQESPRWARSTLGRSPRRRGRSLTKGLEPSFLGLLLPSLLSISAAPSPCLRQLHTKAKCPPSSEATAAVAVRPRPSCALSTWAAHSGVPLCDPRPPLTTPLLLAFGAPHPSRSRRATQDHHGRRQRGSAAQAGGRARSSRPPLPRWPVYLDAVRRLIVGDQHVPVSAAGRVAGSQLRGEG